MNKKDTILLIGNGQSVLNNKFGELIDTFDIVGRINNYNDTNYKKSVGRYTNIWFNGANKHIKKRGNPPEQIIVLIPYDILNNKEQRVIDRTPIRLSLKPNQYKVVNKKTMKEFEDTVNIKRPTTGLSSILWCLKFYNTVIIYGFDFFITSKNHYFDNQLSRFLIKNNILKRGDKHDNIKEKNYVSKLIKEKKVIPLENYLLCNKYQKKYNNQLNDLLVNKNKNSIYEQKLVSKIVVNELNKLNIKYCIGGFSLLGLSKGDVQFYDKRRVTLYGWNINNQIINRLRLKLFYKNLFVKKVHNKKEHYLKIRRKLNTIDGYHDKTYFIIHILDKVNNQLFIKINYLNLFFDANSFKNLKKGIDFRYQNLSLFYPNNLEDFIEKYKYNINASGKLYKNDLKYLTLLDYVSKTLNKLGINFWLDNITALRAKNNNDITYYDKNIFLGINFVAKKTIQELINNLKINKKFTITNKEDIIYVKYYNDALSKIKKSLATYIANHKYDINLCLQIKTHKQKTIKYKKISFKNRQFHIRD